MGSVFNNFSNGPTMILPSSQNHPSFQFPSQSMQGFQAFDSGSWSVNTGHQIPHNTPSRQSSSWTPPSSSKTVFTNPSRKRSRDDLDDEVQVSKHNVNATSISGPSTLVPANARKAQRIDTSSSGSDEVELAWIRHQMQASTKGNHKRSHTANAPFITAEQPQVDDITHLLGISWQRVSHDGDMAPAVSGWEKYINNHYHKYMRDARIILNNRSLNAYLVAALPVQGASSYPTPPNNSNYAAMSHLYQFHPSSSFFLFKEDLTGAQMVASNLDKCLQNIRSTPIQFEGSEILCASERSPEPAVVPEQIKCTVGNGIPIARVNKEASAFSTKVNLQNDSVTTMGMDMEVDS
jgi:hypothetical protein